MNLNMHLRVLRIFAACLTGLLITQPVLSAPGAHGPDGEHLDAPAAKAGTSSKPRMETFSDLFELVATLGGGELSILIDRYATSEPVLNATVEVESGPLKAKAKFHADHGDYSIDDAAFLKAISAPGAHPLVFTIVAGPDSDLLNGTLNVAAAAQVGDHHHEFLGLHERTWLILAAIASVLAIVGIVLWRRSRQRTASWEARA